MAQAPIRQDGMSARGHLLPSNLKAQKEAAASVETPLDVAHKVGYDVAVGSRPGEIHRLEGRGSRSLPSDLPNLPEYGQNVHKSPEKNEPGKLMKAKTVDQKSRKNEPGKFLKRWAVTKSHRLRFFGHESRAYTSSEVGQ
jgi:hypothetical protein